jgi:amidohydrolase
MVRCDMDALPIQEENDSDYVSIVPNTLHACGHDGHTAIGLTVARMLNERRADLCGTVFVFQPAQEIGQGALAMIADSALNDPVPEVCFGLHLWNELPIGQVPQAAEP